MLLSENLSSGEFADRETSLLFVKLESEIRQDLESKWLFIEALESTVAKIYFYFMRILTSIYNKIS